MQTFGLWMWAEGKIVHGRNIMLTLTDCDGNVVTAEGKSRRLRTVRRSVMSVHTHSFLSSVPCRFD